MPNFDPDVFIEALKHVENKSIFDRVKHSKSLHKARSAFAGAGSAASKGAALAGVAARATMKLIPIPVIPDLLDYVERKVEDMYKTYRYERALSMATSAEDIAKWNIKTLNLEDLDRYRWKVAKAMSELDVKLDAFVRLRRPECSDYLVIAIAVAQADRRIYKLQKMVDSMRLVSDLINDYLQECKTGLRNPARNYRPRNGTMGAQDFVKYDLQKKVEWERPYSPNEQDRLHENCEGWCHYKEQTEYDPSLAQIRARAASVIRAMAEVYSFEDEMGSVIEDRSPE